VKFVLHDSITGLPELSAVPLPLNLYSHSDQQIAWQTAIPLEAQLRDGRDERPIAPRPRPAAPCPLR